MNGATGRRTKSAVLQGLLRNSPRRLINRSFHTTIHHPRERERVLGGLHNGLRPFCATLTRPIVTAPVISHSDCHGPSVSSPGQCLPNNHSPSQRLPRVLRLAAHVTLWSTCPSRSTRVHHDDTQTEGQSIVLCEEAQAGEISREFCKPGKSINT